MRRGPQPGQPALGAAWGADRRWGLMRAAQGSQALGLWCVLSRCAGANPRARPLASSAEQIAWFKAGSALNAMAAAFAK